MRHLAAIFVVGTRLIVFVFPSLIASACERCNMSGQQGQQSARTIIVIEEASGRRAPGRGQSQILCALFTDGACVMRQGLVMNGSLLFGSVGLDTVALVSADLTRCGIFEATGAGAIPDAPQITMLLSYGGKRREFLWTPNSEYNKALDDALQCIQRSFRERVLPFLERVDDEAAGHVNSAIASARAAVRGAN